jgi:GNAT superfamily N-acetyltransferase
MREIEVRRAGDEDLDAVARLRWQWLHEIKQRPPGQREEFVRALAAWAQQHATSHHCLVVTRDGSIVGMAWLAVVPRVPPPETPQRASGDVQSVYVVPQERNNGLRSQLIHHALDLAEELGLERVTVHSSVDAVSAYTRQGFAVSARLLQTRPRSR